MAVPIFERKAVKYTNDPRGEIGGRLRRKHYISLDHSKTILDRLICEVMDDKIIFHCPYLKCAFEEAFNARIGSVVADSTTCRESYYFPESYVLDDVFRFGCVVGIGRRKSSIAEVIISLGSGLSRVNNRCLKEYLQYNSHYINTALSPLSYLGVLKKYNIYVHVSGGGIKGQTDAIKLGIARCLCSIYPDIARRRLKALGYIRQDARCKERKKYGLLKARKAPQYSKR